MRDWSVTAVTDSVSALALRRKSLARSIDNQHNLCYNESVGLAHLENDMNNDEMTPYTAEQLASMEFPAQALWERADGELVIVTINAFAKGWAAIQAADKSEAKVRASNLYPLEEEATESGGKMAKVLAKYRMRYVPSVAASGKKSLHNGDPVAQALEYRDLENLYNLASMLLAMDYSELKARYAHLNLGSQRMNLGNRIRAAYRRGDEVVLNWVTSTNATDTE